MTNTNLRDTKRERRRGRHSAGAKDVEAAGNVTPIRTTPPVNGEKAAKKAKAVARSKATPQDPQYTRTKYTAREGQKLYEATGGSGQIVVRSFKDPVTHAVDVSDLQATSEFAKLGQIWGLFPARRPLRRRLRGRARTAWASRLWRLAPTGTGRLLKDEPPGTSPPWSPAVPTPASCRGPWKKTRRRFPHEKSSHCHPPGWRARRLTGIRRDGQRQHSRGGCALISALTANGYLAPGDNVGVVISNAHHACADLDNGFSSDLIASKVALATTGGHSGLMRSSS